MICSIPFPGATPKRLHYPFRRSRVAASDAPTSPNLAQAVLPLDSGWSALHVCIRTGRPITLE